MGSPKNATRLPRNQDNKIHSSIRIVRVVLAIILLQLVGKQLQLHTRCVFVCHFQTSACWIKIRQPSPRRAVPVRLVRRKLKSFRQFKAFSAHPGPCRPHLSRFFKLKALRHWQPLVSLVTRNASLARSVGDS